MVMTRFLFACLLAAGALSVQASQPNIIFILCDDLGYGDVGALFQNSRGDSGQPHFLTPRLDEMAAEGLQLRRHYVGAPVCAPARASLLTGLHQGHANVRDNQFDKALENHHTLGSVLGKAGYATAAVGKWGLQGNGTSPETWEAYPTKRGFDHFFGYVRHRDGHNHYPHYDAPDRPPVELYSADQDISDQLKGCYTTDLFTAEAKRWITRHKRSSPHQPFFLYLAYDTPHAGLQVAAWPYPAGGGLDGGVQWLGERGRAINTAEELIDDYIHPDYADQEWPDVHKRYASMVRRIDDAVGDLFQLLADLDIDSETLVVFTSDNGPHAESYGYGDYRADFFASFGPLDGIKRDVWEGGIRVPALVRWPGKVPAGENNDSPSQFHDWMPTFAELAGVPAPAQTDGVSLVPTLTASGEQREGIVYVEYKQNGTTPGYGSFQAGRRNQRRGQMQAIYQGGYKGVRYGIKAADDDFEIYDTLTDPGEANDLAGENEHFQLLQQEMKRRVLRLRLPDSSAQRPYDQVPVPAMDLLQPVRTGIQYRVFETATPWTPNAATLQVAAVQSGLNRSINLRPLTRQEDVVLEYAGLLRVPETGQYTFALTADGGAVLRLHDILLIDADKADEAGAERRASIHLEKGHHPLRLTYARNSGGVASLALHWSGPNFPKAEIEPEFFAHAIDSEEAL